MSAVLRRLKWIIAGFNNYKALKLKPKPSTSLPTNAASIIPPLSPKKQHQKSTNHKNSIHKPRSTKQHQQPPPRPPPPMLESVHEIGVYIHRFHNLDLFRQGWYQIKITMRLEDADYGALAAPSRVVQYEAPDLGSDDTYGVWRIDDTDHSFSTQPFCIKYARQDILLSVMISFNLSLGRHVGPSTSAVIMKFELLYAASSESRFDLDASLDPCEGAVHEFRIPAKALIGLHSYCPVHFNHDYAVLVDVSIHITLLKGGIYSSSTRILSESCTNEDVTAGHHDNSKQAMLVKSLLVARDLLLEELQKLSKAINQKISLTDFSSNLDELKLFCNLKAGLEAAVAEASEVNTKLHMTVKESNGIVDFQNDGYLNSLSKDDLFCSFHSIGDQLLYLWNTFLNFHRANKTKILEYLHDSWANDRKSEWSIWMVHSKVDMPHQYISSTVECAAIHCINGKAPVLRKLTEDPAQAASMRAQLHRRSIAQMRINNRSIQDMHIFGNPSHVPVVIVESVVNTPRRSTSGNSYFGNLGQKKYSRSLSVGAESNAKIEICGVSTHKNVRDLKIVVFVHGFQGHHLDLRLIRNQWLLIDPKIEFLMSEANQEKTTGDFREMGQRLAQEVVSFVKKKMDKISRSGVLKTIKLSFVGHSIGNLIIRTALTEGIMEPYLGFLYTYVSLSGPHLGYLYSSNSLFNSGLWVMKKLSGTQCFHQLTFTDNPDIRNTFLYKLCKEKTLENFKNIILLSSPQDGYVPYHSARIEMCPASAGDNSKKGKAFLEMLNDCLDQIRARSSDHRVFMRFDVDFDISQQGNTLDTIIGRAAHIQFLESDIFTKFIMWTFPDLFR